MYLPAAASQQCWGLVNAATPAATLLRFLRPLLLLLLLGLMPPAFPARPSLT